MTNCALKYKIDFETSQGFRALLYSFCSELLNLNQLLMWKVFGKILVYEWNLQGNLMKQSAKQWNSVWLPGKLKVLVHWIYCQLS